ncbi:MAG: di-heme oxidoredictase family protein [Burkholderiaceae bacterium]
MRGVKPTLVFVVALSGALIAQPNFAVTKKRARQAAARPQLAMQHLPRPERFTPRGALADEERAISEALSINGLRTTAESLYSEAPAGFDNLTNGFLPQGPAYETLNEDNVIALRSFNDNRFIFEEVETAADGLGPTYNAQSCRECHQNVVTGGASQVAEFRAGRTDKGQFFGSLGGSLIASRATHPDIVEHVLQTDTVRTLRISTNTLGSGFIEAISNATLLAIRDRQPAAMRGTAVLVPVLEANSAPRVGRFGWKSQHASLLSFAADAYLNEMGVTSALFPEENTAGDKFVGYGTEYDAVQEPEDDGVDVTAFADFMRSTKAPSRGVITAEVKAGEMQFTNVGCAVCHTTTIRTASPGTKINGNAFTVPPALGNKIIHPYSDFLLHDVATGDGIPIQPTAEYAGTANKMRTAPLWALRTRNRLMHDGLSSTKEDAIARHGGQADAARARFNALPQNEKRQLLSFLQSL